MKNKGMLLLVAAVFFAGCASMAPDRGTVAKDGEIDREWVEEGITPNFIFARGIGAADQALENKTQKMATSRNSAIVNAQYNMLSIIKGVNLEGGMTVEKALETDSKIVTNVNAAIKSAQVVRSEWTSDDGCVVVLRLPKQALKEMGLRVIEK